MCRSIKTLRRTDNTATDDEIRAAALQFVRKISGYRQPSRANAPAFEQAVDEVALATPGRCWIPWLRLRRATDSSNDRLGTLCYRRPARQHGHHHCIRKVSSCPP